MESLCNYCEGEAIFMCKCRKPNIAYICAQHIQEHISTVGFHKPKVCLKNIKIIKINKELLINKLSDLIAQARKSQLELIETSKAAFSVIQENVDNLNLPLMNFISMCEKIIIDVSSITTIPEAQFYSPINQMLISNDINRDLEKLVGPSLQINKYRVNWIYMPSTLPHLLYNYSDTSVNFLENGTLKLHPQSNRIKSDLLNKYSTCLAVSKNWLLFTGGFPYSDQTLGLNVDTSEFIKAPRMICARKSHCMSWINGYAAVIGGENDNGYLKSVEILINGKWISKENLNHARSSASAVAVLNQTWVMGGIGKNEISSIEKFSNNKWEIIALNEVNSLTLSACAALDVGILIFGGVKKNENNYNAILINTENHLCKQVVSVKSDRFSHNQVYLNNQNIQCIGQSQLIFDFGISNYQHMKVID